MKKKEKNIIRKCRVVTLFFLLVLVMLIPTEVQASKLSKKSVTLLKGKTCTIQLKGTKKKAVWKTSRKTVARFTTKKNTSVKVRALKVGNTTISAKVGKKTYRCKVRVVDPQMSSKSLNLNIGESKVLTIKGGTGAVRWKTNNPAMVTVNKGRVTAKRSGTAQITAVRNGKKMVCAVTVKKTTTSTEKKDDKNNSKPDQPKAKRVWVVTKEAYIVFVPVYEEVGYIKCITCGATFEGENMNVEYGKHATEELLAGYEARYTVDSRRTLIREDRIDYPEEGYWKTIYE